MYDARWVDALTIDVEGACVQLDKRFKIFFFQVHTDVQQINSLLIGLNSYFKAKVVKNSLNFLLQNVGGIIYYNWIKDTKIVTAQLNLNSSQE